MLEFDKVVSRCNTNSKKWDKYKTEDIIPMWIADMDFMAPQPVIDALQQRIAHGIFGYSTPSHSLIHSIVERMRIRYQWNIQPHWILFIPSVVCGLNVSARAFVTGNQRSISPHPIYPPFMKAAHNAYHDQMSIPVVDRQGRWVLDLHAAEKACQGNESLLMLCNPLNPGGTVFRRDELLAQLAFAQRHNLIVCSDEIHADLILDDNLHHIPFGSLSQEAQSRSITLISPSKTFNIAGLGLSMAIISDDCLRKKFMETSAGIVPDVNLLAFTATEAAYRYCQPWVDNMIVYLRQNRDCAVKRINAMSGLFAYPNEATFLLWIDASQLPVDNPHAFFEQAGIGLSPGAEFGNPRFVRLNYGCARSQLNDALDRMENACLSLSR